MSDTQPQPTIPEALALFELERKGDTEFLGESGPALRRLFGGQVAAQALIAAGRTVENIAARPPHSLHAYFLRPGRGGVPVHYLVQHLKDGRNFAARAVNAVQAEEVIFTLHASFAQPEDGLAHQEARMPDSPPPDEVSESSFENWGRSLALRAGIRIPESPVDIREIPRDAGVEPGTKSSLRRLWIRPRVELPEDPLLHAALLTWVSDRSLVRTGVRPPYTRSASTASLDHAMWFHHPPHFDDWLLYAMQSPVAHAARAFIHGSMYRTDGTRVVTVAQEGLIRPGQS